jgi:hypothetical protein
MFIRSARLGFAALALAGSAAAQAVPTTQPMYIDIFREFEKPGHSAAHQATETRWASLNRDVGYPYPYLAYVAISGAPEIWWVTALESFDAFGKSNTFAADNAAYRQSIAKVAMEDGEHISGSIRMQARAMPDAGSGSFPELGKMRVYSILTVRMRPGHGSAFAEIAKHYAAIVAGSGAVGWRAYEVMTGAPAGTYLVFSSFPSWAAVDANEAAWGKAMAGAGAHMVEAGKLAKESIMSSDSRYFEVNPGMSLVSKEMAAADPFWAPKAAATKRAP